MSAQLNQTGYVPSATSFNASEAQINDGRRISDVEQELAVLNKNAEAIDLCADQLEKRLACVLSSQGSVGVSQSKPEVVRVPLANIINTANSRLHIALVRLNDIIARVELPQ